MNKVIDKLTAEVERLLAENAKLIEEKRKDVSIWLKAERDYQTTINRLKAQIALLEIEK